MKWLNRSLLYGPYLALCTSEKAFRKEMKKLKVKKPFPWITEGANATTHTLRSPNRGLMCIVCICPKNARAQLRSIEAIYALLAHEAVHVWQRAKKAIGEKKPGLEQEAYAVQNIAQNLMESYKAQAKR